MNKIFVPKSLLTTGAATSKIGPISTQRAIAQVSAPAEAPGKGQDRINVYTFFTRVGETQILYNGDRLWTTVILTLETAGPVVVGQTADLVPVLSGKGTLLATNTPVTIQIAKGDRVYIAASGVNRVKVQLQAVPWLEAITGMLAKMSGAI